VADEIYDVKAKLTFDGKQADAAVARLGRSMTSASGVANTLTRNLLAVGGAYLGLNAVAGAFRGMVRSALAFETQLQSTRIGLTSIISLVDKVDFGTAGRQATAIYEDLDVIAARTTAETMDLVETFQGIVGPMRAAGVSMERIKGLTEATVQTGAALGVDMAQASRDMQLMVRGTAGMDTRLFAIMTSLGAITESTEEWNKGLTAAERVVKLEKAMETFKASGDIAMRTLPAQLTTLSSNLKRLRAELLGPAFKAFAGFLGRINARIIDNRDALLSYLNAVGERIARAVGPVFEWMITQLDYVVDNWDAIVDGFKTVATELRVLIPQLVKAAFALAAANAVSGAVFGAAGTIQGSGVLDHIGKRGAGGRAASAIGGAFSALSGGSAQAVASAGASTTLLGPLGASLAALAPVAAAVGAALAVVAALAIPVIENLDFFAAAMSSLWNAASPLVEALGTSLYESFAAIGNILMMVLMPAFVVMYAQFRVLMEVLTPILKLSAKLATIFANLARAGLKWILYGLEKLAEKFTKVEGPLKPLIEWLGKLADKLWLFLDEVVDASAQLGPEAQEGRDRARRQEAEDFAKDIFSLGEASLANLYDDVYRRQALRFDPEDPFGINQQSRVLAPQDPTGTGNRPSVVNDFRGSKFTIKQDFRDADPDRVLRIFTRDLERQAEKRVRSPNAPAFTG